MISKFIYKVKDKLSKNKATYPSVNEYAFSTEEIESISEQNKQKIQELKQDAFPKKKEEKKRLILEDDVSPIMGKPSIEGDMNKEIIDEEVEFIKEVDSNEREVIQEEDPALESNDGKESVEEVLPKDPPKNSFVHLNEEYQKIVMTKWEEIDLKQIDKDIIDGKDLLNHNYTITYADEAVKFIHGIRKRYEVVICYLIGFNNEKKGIYEKTIFSDKMENEWRYLNNYIKVLEKIRNFRK